MNIHQITLFLEEVELNQITNVPITNNLDKILIYKKLSIV